MQTYTQHPKFDITDAEMKRYGEPQHEVDCDAVDCLYGPPQHETVVEDVDWLVSVAASAFRSGYETPPATESPEPKTAARAPPTQEETTDERPADKLRLTRLSQ